MHHVCRYGASSQSLSLLLVSQLSSGARTILCPSTKLRLWSYQVPATSLSTTPNGYTPLHLLARYQVSMALLYHAMLLGTHLGVWLWCIMIGLLVLTLAYYSSVLFYAREY